jgi:hypothetical protein
MSKTIEKVFLAAIAVAVLCAGTLSAHQLRTGPKAFATCGGSCGVNKPCATGCLCIFPMESGSPFCSSHPIPGSSLVK